MRKTISRDDYNKLNAWLVEKAKRRTLSKWPVIVFNGDEVVVHFDTDLLAEWESRDG